MEERKTRRSYSLDEDTTIVEMVDTAKKEGYELGAVYKMLADDLDRTEAAVQKRYGDIKRAEKAEAAGEPVSLKQLAIDMETTPIETEMVQQYVKSDIESTMRMYEALKREEIQKAPEVSMDSLVNKLEEVITEKIEMRIERDYYKKKYEELQTKYDKVRRLLED